MNYQVGNNARGWRGAGSWLSIGSALESSQVCAWQCVQELEREDTAGQLRLLQSDQLGGGELMLFQLPSILPTVRKGGGPGMDVKGKASTSSPSDAGFVSLRDLPSGKV